MVLELPDIKQVVLPVKDFLVFLLLGRLPEWYNNPKTHEDNPTVQKVFF